MQTSHLDGILNSLALKKHTQVYILPRLNGVHFIQFGITNPTTAKVHILSSFENE